MRSRSDRTYLLVVLLLILSSNYVDRSAFALVMQDIKRDLELTDTQLGLLTGIAFALFYSVMGVPIARWADRGNRVTIIAMTTAVWSSAVVLCAAAGSFVQLLMIRIGAAIGEAGCVPPAHSLIADHFTRAERPRAVSIYMLGGPLSVIVGYFVAGWANELYGWRWMFVLIGAPGLVLAAIARLTLKEPRCAGVPSAAAAPHVSSVDFAGPSNSSLTVQPTLREVCVTLWSSAPFRHLLLYFSVMWFFSNGVGQWMPSFLIRSYGLQTGQLGTWFAVIFGIGGLLGTYLGGVMASRWAARDERLQLRGMAVVVASAGIAMAAMCVTRNLTFTVMLLIVQAVGGGLTYGPLFAIIQSLVPANMRAMSIAIIYLCANLIGMGLGPLAAGSLSDALQEAFGEESLRYALLVLCPGTLWAGWHLCQASRALELTRPGPGLSRSSS